MRLIALELAFLFGQLLPELVQGPYCGRAPSRVHVCVVWTVIGAAPRQCVGFVVLSRRTWSHMCIEDVPDNATPHACSVAVGGMHM